jgi:hypothetical protein
MQTHLGSIIETVINLVIGIIVSLIINAMIMPAVGCTISHAENLMMVAIFTVTSLIRSYSLRRLFNWIAFRFKV